MFHCLIIKDLCRSNSDQLIYFITELFVCQELFKFIFWSSFELPENVLSSAVLSISNSFILSNSFAFVKNFFQVFLKQFFQPAAATRLRTEVFLFQKNSCAVALADSLVIITPPKAKVNTFFRIFLFLEKYIQFCIFIILSNYLLNAKNQQKTLSIKSVFCWFFLLLVKRIFAIRFVTCS